MAGTFSSDDPFSNFTFQPSFTLLIIRFFGAEGLIADHLAHA